MRFRVMLALVLAVFVLTPTAASAGPKDSASPATCTLPESDAEGFEIALSTYYQGYWWDHTDLTIAVNAHPKATEEQLDSVHEAIAIWSDVLLSVLRRRHHADRRHGTGTNNQQVADMVLVFFRPLQRRRVRRDRVSAAGRTAATSSSARAAPGSEFESTRPRELMGGRHRRKSVTRSDSDTPRTSRRAPT